MKGATRHAGGKSVEKVATHISSSTNFTSAEEEGVLAAMDPENRARVERLRATAFQPVLELAEELECRVNNDQFKRLRMSARVRNALRDKRLRELIMRIDGSWIESSKQASSHLSHFETRTFDVLAACTQHGCLPINVTDLTTLT